MSGTGAMVQAPLFLYPHDNMKNYYGRWELGPFLYTQTCMNKSELRKKILTIEGLTNEEKSALLELLNKEKKYGLVWENKPEDVEERLRDRLPVFKEVKSRAILSDSPDAPNHILIEGDNLEALTALSYTHEGKIDVIYIDPPYNTGNKDFIYNDSFVDSEDGYRHSKWLSFMSKRLRIAKRLLSDKGVIFISIDDNEQAQLKLLCDEVFGMSNYISQFIWKKKQGGGNDSKQIVVEHEYIYSYSKNASLVQLGLDTFYKPSDSLYPFSDDKGDYGLITLDKASIQFSQSLVFEIVGPQGETYYPRIVNGKQSCWRWSQKKVKDQYRDLVFKKGKVYTKYYRPNGITPRSLLIDSCYGRTESGKDDIAAIFGKSPFSYPKPVSLIKYCLSIGSQNNSTILDFFAGSGTTLHATMQLNSEDGGNRQCIFVTNNENNICEEVTYERNKRVINGYTTPKGEAVEGLKNNSLRYYKTELLPREKSPRNMRALIAAATELLCIKEDLYEESIRFGRYKTSPKTIRYFEKGGKRMLIIFCEELADQIAEEIKTLDFGGQRLKIYIFSPDRYAFDDNFYEVQDKVQLVALPAAIYDAYRRVLPKRIDKPLLEVEADEIPTYTITAGETPTLAEAKQQSIDFNFE